MGKGKRLLALLGLGALAYWKYKKSSPEDQQKVKDQINKAKENVNRWGNELKGKANELGNKVEEKAREKL